MLCSLLSVWCLAYSLQYTICIEHTIERRTTLIRVYSVYEVWSFEHCISFFSSWYLVYRCSFLVLFMHLLSVVFLLLFILFYSFFFFVFLLLRFCLVSYGLYRIFCAYVVIVHWLLWLCFFKVRHFQTFRFYYSMVLKMDMLTCMNILPKETNDQQFGLFQKPNKSKKKWKITQKKNNFHILRYGGQNFVGIRYKMIDHSTQFAWIVWWFNSNEWILGIRK